MKKTVTPEEFDNYLHGEIKGLTIHKARSSLRLDIVCQAGDHMVSDAFTSPNRLPPHIIVTKLKRMGWHLGKHPCCPDHATAQRKPHMPDPTTAAPRAAPSLRSVPSPSPDTRAARREAWQMIDEAFDIEAGRYSTGITDATIAEMTGLSEEAVSSIRDLDFGPIKEPQEIEIARTALEAIQREAFATVERINEFAESEIAKLRASVEAVRTDIARLVKVNRWKE